MTLDLSQVQISVQGKMMPLEDARKLYQGLDGYFGEGCRYRHRRRELANPWRHKSYGFQYTVSSGVAEILDDEITRQKAGIAENLNQVSNLHRRETGL